MTYLNRIEEKLNKEVVKTYIEETIGKCITLEQSVFHAVDNWTDILPELKRQIKDLEKLDVIDAELIAKEIDLKTIEDLNINLQSEIKKLTGTSNKTIIEREKLEKELESERKIAKKLREEKDKLLEERKQKAKSLLTSDLSSGSILSSDLNIAGTGPAVFFGDQNPNAAGMIGLAPQKCKLCKEPYYPSVGVDWGYCEKHSSLGGIPMVVIEDDD